MKRIKFTTVLTPEDFLDVTLHVEKQEVIKFALNYRAFVKSKWREIYRIDNFHGFLHEQRFWKSPKPIRLDREEKIPLNIVLERYADQIIMNFQEYRCYFEEKNEK